MRILRAVKVDSSRGPKIRPGMYWKGVSEGWVNDPHEAAQVSWTEANTRMLCMDRLGIIAEALPAPDTRGKPAQLRCIKLSPDCDEIIFAFGNDRFQAARFRPDSTAADVVKGLRDLANRIENDRECYDASHTDH